MGASRAALRRVNVVPGVAQETQRALAEAERNSGRAVSDLERFKFDSLVITDTKTKAYEARLGELVLCNPTGGAFTVSLPRLTPRDSGRHICVKNASSSLNVISVMAAPGQTTDGVSGYAINGAYDSVWLFSDGSNWWRVGG